SRLTRARSLIPANAVRASEVATTWTVNRSSSMRATVRQAPCTATLSPSSRSRHGDAIVRSSPPSRELRCTMVPTAVIIPVNISALQHEQGVIAECTPIHGVPTDRLAELAFAKLRPRCTATSEPDRRLQLVDPVHEVLPQQLSCEP